jgi:phosphoglycolate phosphatase-like HAD superfamily hydrolase
VGDSSLDMQAGRAAGAVCMGCLWGVGSTDELRSAGAGFIAESVEDLAGYLYLLCEFDD